MRGWRCWALIGSILFPSPPPSVCLGGVSERAARQRFSFVKWLKQKIKEFKIETNRRTFRRGPRFVTGWGGFYWILLRQKLFNEPGRRGRILNCATATAPCPEPQAGVSTLSLLSLLCFYWLSTVSSVCNVLFLQFLLLHHLFDHRPVSHHIRENKITGN